MAGTRRTEAEVSWSPGPVHVCMLSGEDCGPRGLDIVLADGGSRIPSSASYFGGAGYQRVMLVGRL